MSRHSRIAVFDFDGTITRRDTLTGFLQFTHGWRFYAGFALLLPVLVLYKLGLVRNCTAKRIVFSLFFKGWSAERFDKACHEFILRIETRPAALAAIRKHLQQGDTVVIVSASIENWVRPWAETNGIGTVLGTRIEIDAQGRITGRFLTPNCYGTEKVNRLEQRFPELIHNRGSICVTAYGDSRGDRELLAFADRGYYKTF